MKSCSKNRKLIAWMAVEALPAQEAQLLQHHLETCHTCRRYYDEVFHATQKLSTVQPNPDIQTSEGFHQRLLGALRAEQKTPAWPVGLLQLCDAFRSWRLAVPVLSATALLTIVFWPSTPNTDIAVPGPVGKPLVSSPIRTTDPEPTISNYQIVAGRSLDKLDELLTRQGNQAPASTPIYTASSLAQVNALD